MLTIVPIFQQALPALQVDTEELMNEVENSIAEFKRSKQEYDEDRVQEQVSMTIDNTKKLFDFVADVFFLFLNCLFLATVSKSIN